MRSQLVPVARLPDDTLEPALLWWINNRAVIYKIMNNIGGKRRHHQIKVLAIAAAIVSKNNFYIGMTAFT